MVYLHSDFNNRVDSVAQPVEHYTFNVGVLGSSPSGITEKLKPQIYCGFFVLKVQLRRQPRNSPDIFITVITILNSIVQTIGLSLPKFKLSWF